MITTMLGRLSLRTTGNADTEASLVGGVVAVEPGGVDAEQVVRSSVTGRATCPHARAMEVR